MSEERAERGPARLTSGPPPSGRNARRLERAGPSTRPNGALGVLVLTSLGRDAALLVQSLSAAGLRASATGSAPELLVTVSEEVTAGRPPRLGVLLVTDDALGVEWSDHLAEVLECQAPWSDLPIVLLAGPGGRLDEHGILAPHDVSPVAERFTARGSTTVLDRPVRAAVLVSAVRAAMRARTRQVEVRELIRARDRALAEAERANRAKSEFLGMMSHELRTPLNAIAGYVQLLEMGIHGPITSAQRGALERIGQAQRHVLGLLENLLSYARIEAGRVEYRMESVPLAPLISEAVAMMEPQLVGKGLSCQGRPTSPSAYSSRLQVEGDPDKLRQILLNLLSNAVKFTPEGGRIAIDVMEPPRPWRYGEVVRVEVTDTGVGIPPDKLEAIFEPFVQVEGEGGTNGSGGAGLGLAISRELARRMGGDLTARSTPGEGSTFTLSVRLAQQG